LPTNEPTDIQRALCQRYDAAFMPVSEESRVGIALQTLGDLPLNGLRIPETEGVSGWYLWGGGEPSDAPDFYQPLCVEHLPEYCREALPFLGLPPGWRFLTDGEYTDVWFDETLPQGG
jgi:hypothetical protein